MMNNPDEFILTTRHLALTKGLWALSQIPTLCRGAAQKDKVL